ncbi:MAG: cell division ATP-binding protein FtsE [Acidimicrobiales bacterium]|nr:cell division ATP-binding protein FtsE [Hyphomonadaceae bacterium]RZV42438.1 MAG: cell division ATP-binding protein FtsE [Acidimicrobiales bacterium]
MSSHPLSTQPEDEDSIRFEHVGMRYGRGEEVLNDVSFTLKKGSMNFLTGPSGAGKSSLLKLMYLNMRPSRGLITLFGQDTSQIDIGAIPVLKRRMGVVLQDFRLIQHLNVFENVALPLRVAGVKRDAYQENVVSLLKWVGLGDRMRALPPTLSGGEKQRAAIARAVISKPEILIADEPTGNVDMEIGKRLIRLFSELNRLGTTVIIATHDLSLIPSGATHMTLNNGVLTIPENDNGSGAANV